MKIKIENLSKEFNNNLVLKNVNIIFESGKIYGLSGRNGSGKSVFLKMIAGLYIQTEGKILFDEKEYNFKKEFPKDMGAFIEKPSFFPDLSGYENLKLLANIKREINDEEIERALEIVNLEAEKDKKYCKYSLGMKQKLGIAQAIMENQKIILLDEAFNGVDDKSVEKIKKYLLKEKKNDKLIIISSHITEDLNSMCDEVYRFNDGKVIKEND